MTIYIYIISFSLIPILYSLSRYTKQKAKTFCAATGIVIFLLMIYTPIELRADYDIYSAGYEYISSLSFKSMCAGFHLFKRHDLPWPYVFESGFVTFQWLCSHIGLDYYTWTLLYAAMCIVVISKFIKNYSLTGWISYLIWMAFYFYSMVGRFRQSLALILVMVSLKYVKDKKLWKFLIILAIAFLFHQSSFIFIPIYCLGNISMNKRKYLKWLALVTTGSFVVGNYLLPVVLNRFGYSTEVHIISFALNKRLLLVFAFCILAYFKTDFNKVEGNRNKTILYWGTILTLGMSVVGAYESLVSRAVEYYFIFFLLLIPDLLSYYKKRVQYIANVSLFASLLIYYYIVIRGSGLVPIG